MQNSELAKLQEVMTNASSSVIALDLMSVQALGVAAELSEAFREVNEGLTIAQKLRMRYLFIGVNPAVGRCVCMPLSDMSRITDALTALRAQVLGQGKDAATGKTAWVVIPEAWKAELIPTLQRNWANASIN